MSAMTHTDTEIKVLRSHAADKVLYRLDPPYVDEWSTDSGPYEYVVVSATMAYGEPETYIFGADADGKIPLLVELSGSFRGDLNHAQALRNAGYEIVERTS